MKTIFKIVFVAFGAVLTALSTVAFSGCEKAGKYLDVAPKDINFAAVEGSVTVRVSASSLWMFSSGAGWLTCTYSADDANMMTVRAAANEEPVERAAEIVFTSSDGQMFTVPVVQAAAVVTPETPETPETPVARFDSDIGGASDFEVEPFVTR